MSEIPIETPYGPPSASPVVGELAGRRIAFIPRHGLHHEIPAHKVNYRANLWAMKELGVERVIAPCAVGSLRREVEPGTFVVCDQVVDRTTGRADTFYDGPESVHVSFADPYCEVMRDVITARGRDLKIAMRETGTVCVIQGPRFSSRAESAWFREAGWTVVSMTQYPESILARELELCYANISLVTDYDSGVDGIAPVTADEVFRVFGENLTRLRELLFSVIPSLPTTTRACPCASALAAAKLEA